MFHTDSVKYYMELQPDFSIDSNDSIHRNNSDPFPLIYIVTPIPNRNTTKRVFLLGGVKFLIPITFFIYNPYEQP